MRNAMHMRTKRLLNSPCIAFLARTHGQPSAVRHRCLLPCHFAAAQRRGRWLRTGIMTQLLKSLVQRVFSLTAIACERLHNEAA